MERKDYCNMAETLLLTFCDSIGPRPVGSRENREATGLFSAWMEECGMHVTHQTFDCMDWKDHGSSLLAEDEVFQVYSGPYSPPAEVEGPVLGVSTLSELEGVDADGSILLLHGALAEMRLMPKNFTFYNPPEHKHVVSLLESSGALAVMAATGPEASMLGGTYPYPMIEDGDFLIPNAFMTDLEGQRLLDNGGMARLRIETESTPSKSCNVLASEGEGRKVVLMAHIDSKDQAPGALDNASGVVSLMMVAEMLQDVDLGVGVEFWAINGEDHYANPGELLFLESQRDAMDDIVLGINIDGVGYRHGQSRVSFYGVEGQGPLEDIFAQRDLGTGKGWEQGDHMLLVKNNVPALAITSEPLEEIMTIAHTPEDTADHIDPCRLADVAMAVVDLIRSLT